METLYEKPNGDPSIFGRTDYGSEFFLGNELDYNFSQSRSPLIIRYQWI